MPQLTDKATSFWLFCLFAILYLLSGSGHFYASDDVQKLAVLTSSLGHGTLAIPHGWVKGLYGFHYAWFPLGASLVMVPGFWLGHLALALFPFAPSSYMVNLCVSLENAFFSAALISVVFLYARFLGHGRQASVFAALALGLGTMVWPYAKTSWSEPAATLCVFGGIFVLHKVLDAKEGCHTRLLLAAGTLLALGAFIRQELILVALGALAFFWWRGPKRSLLNFTCLVGPLIVVLLIGFGYDYARYGALFTFPNFRVPQSHLLEEGRFGRSLKNLYQYALSPNQGLLWFSPAVLAGLLGFKRFWRRQPRACGLFLSALLPMALFYVFGWGLSSWAWGLRYDYVFLPFLLLPAATLWEEAIKARQGLILLVLVGASVQMLGLISDFDALYQQEIERHPGLNIQGVMTLPVHSPLLLAARNAPSALNEGFHALDGAELSFNPATARANRKRLPDSWFFLPLPLSLRLGALIAGLAAFLASLGGLLGLYRPKSEKAETRLGLSR
jgi:hypothetical protein